MTWEDKILSFNMNHTLKLSLQTIKSYIASHPLEEQVELLNYVRRELHEISPFKNEPVDCVTWVKTDNITANDYNPNSVAKIEMQLLEVSILNDGYTQPVVTWKPKQDEPLREVVDGYHRNLVAKNSTIIRERIFGYLPVVTTNNTDKSSRIASTIRHNRARGKHGIDAMSDIVVELKNRNWNNERISRELGMEEDEILRLCQITGLADLFADRDFSKSWDIKDNMPDEFIPLTDIVTDEEKEKNNFRTVNTSDEKRVFHTFDKWECHKAGFYNSSKPGMTKEQCEREYCRFLKNDEEFREALANVITTWEKSCEHYLTNNSMNRIAWLGQASLCYAKGIPSVFRSGFNLLTEDEQQRANETALEYLNIWLENHGMETVDLVEATTDKQTMIY